MQLAADVDLTALATACHGYSGADLAALAREAAMSALAASAAAFLSSGPAGPESSMTQGLGEGRTPLVLQPESSATLGLGEGSRSRGADSVGLGLKGFEQRGEGADMGMGGTGQSPWEAWRGQEAGGWEAMGWVKAEHFVSAMRRVGPSIVRGLEVEVPKTRCAQFFNVGNCYWSLTVGRPRANTTQNVKHSEKIQVLTGSIQYCASVVYRDSLQGYRESPQGFPVWREVSHHCLQCQTQGTCVHSYRDISVHSVSILLSHL